jgi:hypothetical protein
MKTKSTPTGFDARRHLRILKAIVITTNVFVLFMYASLFFIFADMPFNAMDELRNIGNSLGWATGFGIGFSFLIFAGDGISWWVRNRKQVKYPTVTTNSAADNFPAPTPLMIKRPMIGREFSSN